MKNTTLKKKIQRIRKKLRLVGILPPFGGELNENQQLIWDQLRKGDFSHWEDYQKNKFKDLSVGSNVGTLSNQRYYVRKKLRENGNLPPFGQPLNEEQQKIEDQVNANDFSFFDTHLKKMRTTPNFVCKLCGDDDLLNFYISNKSKCKKCISLHMKKKYTNGDFFNRQEENKKWTLCNFIHYKVQQAKHRSIRKGIEFNITNEIIEDIFKKQDGKCYFTNIELTFSTHDWNSLSIDRLDNNLGYIKDNIVLVTRFINSSKNAMTVLDFVDSIKKCHLGLIDRGFLNFE